MDVIASIANHTVVQLVFGLTLLFLFADVVTGTLAALRAHEFTSTRVAEWLDSHVLKRVVPALLLVVLAAGVSAFDNHEAAPPILATIATALWTATWAAVLVYAYETLGSLGVNIPTLATGSRPADPLIK